MKSFKNSIVSLLRIWIIMGIQYFIITTVVSAAVKPDTLSFLHITDSHIIFNLKDCHPNIEKARNHFGEGISPLEQLFKSIQRENQTNFVVMTGDLIDFYEAETSAGGMTDNQIEQFARLLDMSYLPMYLTLGNHDIASDYVKNNSYVTRQYNAKQARAAWIRNTPCFKYGTYYSRVFKVDTTSFRFIFPDNYKLTQVQTAAFGYDPKNWRVIRITGENILISYPGNSEIQSVIKFK